MSYDPENSSATQLPRVARIEAVDLVKIINSGTEGVHTTSFMPEPTNLKTYQARVKYRQLARKGSFDERLRKIGWPE